VPIAQFGWPIDTTLAPFVTPDADGAHGFGHRLDLASCISENRYADATVQQRAGRGVGMRDRAIAAAFAVSLVVMSVSPGIAQAPPDLINPQIQIKYVPPPADKAELTATYNTLVQRKPLETLQQFLAPLKLDRPLLIETDTCGATYPAYVPGGPAKLCYEFVKKVVSLAPTVPVQLMQTVGHTPVKPNSASVGPVVQELLHEATVALFDLYQVPIWGRKDDAADRMTAFILLNFPQYDMAWNTIVGTAYYLAATALAPPDLSDVRGVTAQRYYTTLCLAYGGDPNTFGSFLAAGRGDNGAAGDLPPQRAQLCSAEYNDIKLAYAAMVAPHIDAGLLKRVQAVQWIDFND
jgi:hypothetical protein